MNEKKDLTNLFQNLKDCLDVYTTSELSDALVTVLNKRDKKSIAIERVVDAICEVFQCKKKVLINASMRGDNRLPCHVLIVFLNKEYDINHRYITNEVFNMNPNSHVGVFNVIKRYKNLNPNVKTDAEFISYYEKVREVVNGII